MSLEQLRRIFCCCLHNNVEEHVIEEPDESSRLIPPSDSNEVASGSNLVYVDHRRLKERLGTIVRAKEGRMVNVNSHVPFDLQRHTISITTAEPSLRASMTAAPPAHPRNYVHDPSPLPSVEDAPAALARNVYESPSQPPSTASAPHSRPLNSSILQNARLIGDPTSKKADDAEAVGQPSREDDDRTEDARVENSHQPNREDLKLRNAGAIALSWGD